MDKVKENEEILYKCCPYCGSNIKIRTLRDLKLTDFTFEKCKNIGKAPLQREDGNDSLLVDPSSVLYKEPSSRLVDSQIESIIFG